MLLLCLLLLIACLQPTIADGPDELHDPLSRIWKKIHPRDIGITIKMTNRASLLLLMLRGDETPLGDRGIIDGHDLPFPREVIIVLFKGIDLEA